MPTLQGLPQELLEMVFLYSMNISLPQASPELGRKLSSHAMCMTFCMRLFFETVEHKANMRDRKVTSDPDIQSQLLNCRFFTYRFFLSYVQRAHDALIHVRSKAWATTSVTVPDASFFEGLWPFRFTKITYLGFAEGFRIPEKLLHGPWTYDKTSLLYVLVALNGEIDWSGTLAGETAKEGIKGAIAEGNELAVAALSVLLGVAEAITTDVLRYSIVECGCDFKILRHLLFNAQILFNESPKEDLDFHDPILWQWADGEGMRKGKGDKLKDMLKKAAKFSFEFYREGETDWQRIVPFPYSGPRFDARASFDDVVRELLARLYRNYGRRITRRRSRRLDESVHTTGAINEEVAEL